MPYMAINGSDMGSCMAIYYAKIGIQWPRMAVYGDNMVLFYIRPYCGQKWPHNKEVWLYIYIYIYVHDYKKLIWRINGHIREVQQCLPNKQWSKLKSVLNLAGLRRCPGGPHRPFESFP